MGYHIERPREAGTTRRDALGMAMALLGGTFTVGMAAPEDTAPPDDECLIEYDAEFEEALALAEAELPDDTPRFGPPTKGAPPLRRSYRVTEPYGVRGNWAGGHHTGVDLAVPRGTPVYAVGGGTVVLAARSGSYGNAVTVRMPDGHYAVYAHLHRIRTRKGTPIPTGARIGDSGSTGRTTGPHLHLEIRARRGYGSDVNPVSYLARRGVPIHG
ncbi:M23 family metallopeptidase [Streptomyces violascens]|uniref:M23 family metallopeptidase n=2 Tax=Streptomyces violascens TaxID=67381 RepID=UPI00366100CF